MTGRPKQRARGYLQTVDSDHGRLETRRYWTSDDIGWFADKERWEGLRGIGMVESVREVRGVRSYERRCFLVSFDRNARRFARACRSHWGVENPLHWVLDVTFREEDSRVRSGHAPENLPALRRLALNLLKSEKTQSKLSVRGKRLIAAWYQAYVLEVLGN